MENKERATLSRFRGAVIGAGIADALALPWMHYSRAFLRSMAAPLGSEFVHHHSGFHPRGQHSTSTQQMLAVLESITASEGVSGESMATHLVPLWRDSLLIEPDPVSRVAMERLWKGAADWEHSGLEPGHAEASPLSRAPPIALWHQEDPARASADAAMAARITHQDPRVAASAAASAAAIAHNARTDELLLGTFLDSVSGAAGALDPLLAEAVLDFPRVLSMSEYRALARLESYCPDDRYPESAEGLGPYCVPAFLAAVYYFLRSPYNYEKTMNSVLRVGGRMDVAAFLAGAMCGALVGDDGLPESLVLEFAQGECTTAGIADFHNAWVKGHAS